jgi:hypothetical protein
MPRMLGYMSARHPMPSNGFGWKSRPVAPTAGRGNMMRYDLIPVNRCTETVQERPRTAMQRRVLDLSSRRMPRGDSAEPPMRFMGWRLSTWRAGAEIESSESRKVFLPMGWAE